MVIPKEVLSDYRELYEKANALIEQDSRSDPPTDPYRSHYKARDILHDLKKQLEDQLISIRASEDEGSHDEFAYQSMLGFICRDLGRIHIYTEESIDGEKILKRCLELVEERKQRPQCIIAYVGAINELSIVYAARLEYKKALELLLQAEQNYEEFQAGGELPMTMFDLFNPVSEDVELTAAATGSKELENLYTLCCFYLAQMWGHVGEPEKTAQCCHRTLHRQIKYKCYEAIDFALNTATLSQYYIGQERFKEARHLLAAATLIMAEHEANMLQPQMSQQQQADVAETFKHRYADVARCWAKYGLLLLQSSKERLMRDDEEEEEHLAQATKQLKLVEEDYRFLDLDLAACENRISCDYCLTFDDAKLVFHFVSEWLDVAKDYYKAESEATEYARIMQDYAEAYDHIAFFEELPENQAKMQKRRAKYLEDLLELLDHGHYLKICRECWYVAGTAHAAILDIRLDAIKAQSSPTPADVKRVNQSCWKAIKHFECFVKSYLVQPDAGDLWRPNMDVGELRTMLYAHFHIGRLYYKLISSHPQQQLEQLNQSLLYYKRFSESCVEHKEAAERLHGEIGVVREMLELLPYKINTVKRRLE
ncbi:KIF-binding protein [Drosophila grimshawi]|uniref:KIF-binding protein n=1 Tax=Drosophila grimshawi TaxID=7222 RepID=B4JD00_DROGR|nr:KIF-binding protein [Drosophila grimshawi]EDW04244.1 GH10090 [Drosophila grimshawi]